ncbi:Uncharacterised protein [Mycobacteroides abscessus subsp. abscessus]|nr:Uncharacterised protein [Mycobacteroides abscessus subsp. abscessus]
MFQVAQGPLVHVVPDLAGGDPQISAAPLDHVEAFGLGVLDQRRDGGTVGLHDHGGETVLVFDQPGDHPIGSGAVGAYAGHRLAVIV